MNAKYIIKRSFACWVFALVLVAAGCSLQKKTRINRGLQNLTAHYNILFNANELLQQKQDTYAAGFVDDYTALLNVYQDTSLRVASGDKELEAVVAKGNNIISNKDQSRYVGDAYMLLGKAAYLNGDYYNAIEYFGYVTRTYATQMDLVQQARAWQARALMYIGQLPQAGQLLDSALKDLSPKSKVAGEIYAATLQYHINAEKYPEAEDMAKRAIAAAPGKQQRLRLIFVLGQLQELNRKPAEAYNSYTRVVKSNAPFVLSFNADLNRIRINNQGTGRQLSRADLLKNLLRNQNNAEFTDQIYYQLGELQLNENKIDEAVKNYKLSVKNSTRNQTQKGLSYLRLADINFKNKGDYVTARLYYDSTLLSLPSNYPGYNGIKKKADNLQLLADRLHIISREDTLQALSKLNENERNLRIDEIVKNQAQQQATNPTVTGRMNGNANNTNPAVPDNTFNNTGTGLPDNGPNTAASAAGSFYYDNASTISQGFTDFKRKWGDRRLEDNWRRSNRSNSNITTNTQNTTQNVDLSVVPSQQQVTSGQVAAKGYRQELLNAIPLTPVLLSESNTRVYNAYIDIANFYRDILDDKPEAISIYLTLVNRFPENENQPSLYYNLYRLYSDTDPAKAETYKKLLLEKYRQSVFAKVIADPDYAKRLDDKDAEINAFYNDVYDQYAKRQYPQVISRADELLKQYPDSKLAAQIAYLRALASGHQEKVAPLQAELKQIAAAYPNDQLITPLVQQHLAYIDANLAEMQTRKFAIVDSDPNAIPFVPVADLPQPAAIAKAPVQQKPADAGRPAVQQPKPVQQAQQPAARTQPVSIFSLRDSSRYYFVVNVGTGTVNLSSSRFGIGQFNRTSYQNAPIRHQLKPVGDDNQLIYVGMFTSLEDAKFYARSIIPLMPQIMKVPADKYSFFIITQENLDKLADKKLLDSYIDYYQQNY